MRKYKTITREKMVLGFDGIFKTWEGFFKQIGESVEKSGAGLGEVSKIEIEPGNSVVINKVCLVEVDWDKPVGEKVRDLK